MSMHLLGCSLSLPPPLTMTFVVIGYLTYGRQVWYEVIRTTSLHT
jgi:hypothetical protein